MLGRERGRLVQSRLSMPPGAVFGWDQGERDGQYGNDAVHGGCARGVAN